MKNNQEKFDKINKKPNEIIKDDEIQDIDFEIIEGIEKQEGILKFGEIRKKLESFKQAREKFVLAEKTGKNLKEAKENYEKERAEYVGEKLWRGLKEQERITEAKAEYNKKGFARKFYEWSSSKYLMPKKWVDKINQWQQENKTSKAGKILAKVGIGMTSVRNIASYGLLGGGLVLGARGVGNRKSVV